MYLSERKNTKEITIRTNSSQRRRESDTSSYQVHDVGKVPAQSVLPLYFILVTVELKQYPKYPQR